MNLFRVLHTFIVTCDLATWPAYLVVMNNTYMYSNTSQRRKRRVRKIIPGGQTGTDQAARRAATDAGLEIGGWRPPTKTCEAGHTPLDLSQHLLPTSTEKSPCAPPNVERSLRTEWNVRDSDATLIFRLEHAGQQRLPRHPVDFGLRQIALSFSKDKDCVSRCRHIKYRIPFHRYTGK